MYGIWVYKLCNIFSYFFPHNIFQEKINDTQNLKVQALAPLAQVPNICLLLYGDELSYAVYFLIQQHFSVKLFGLTHFIG